MIIDQPILDQEIEKIIDRNHCISVFIELAILSNIERVYIPIDFFDTFPKKSIDWISNKIEIVTNENKRFEGWELRILKNLKTEKYNIRCYLEKNDVLDLMIEDFKKDIFIELVTQMIKYHHLMRIYKKN